MHVLFFNRSYYPDTAATGQLLTELAEDLVRDHGCRVTVVCGPPLNPAPGTQFRPKRLVKREEHNGVTILRARGTRLDKNKFRGRALNYMSYFVTACAAGLRATPPDVCVALTDPPIIGLAAYAAARRHRVPLVMVFQDLFPEVTALLADFHSDTVNAGLQRVNKFLIRKAARVVALGPTMRQRLLEDKGAPAAKTVTISNWADTTSIVPGPKENPFARAHGLVSKFVVMHSGNLGLSQSLETIVAAAARLRDVPDIQFVFQGEGVKKAELIADAAARGLTNILFLPYQSKERLGESFAAADVFIVSLQRGLAGYIVPSKLYGILAAGRPYVAAVERNCEVSAVTRDRSSGLIAEPGDAHDLADKILTYYRDRDLWRQHAANARAASADSDRRTQVSKYFKLFEEVVASAPPALASVPETAR
jgi:glycosyltransferase involved in cell wall biosynthesis